MSVKRPTINDVAELAGVSKGAVSRAFSGTAKFSPATMARIFQAADQIGWRPSAAARIVNGAPARTIGLIVRRDPGLFQSDYFFASLVSGALSRLSPLHYSLSLAHAENEDDELEAYERSFREGRVDGFVITDLRAGDARFPLLTRMNAPAVVVGNPHADWPLPLVYADIEPATIELLERWIAVGRTRIAYVAGDLGLAHARGRQDLWARVLVDNGLDPSRCAEGAFDPSRAADVTRELMDTGSPPTAILYANDEMAVAGLQALAELGVSVPGDVAVAGIDGIPMAAYTMPPLATVKCDYFRVGQLAVDEFLKRFRGESFDSETLVPVQLELAASSGLSE